MGEQNAERRTTAGAVGVVNESMVRAAAGDVVIWKLDTVL